MPSLEYRTVSLNHGWLWIHLALRMYRRNPLMWIAYTTAIVIIGALLTLIPLVGTLVFQLIAPVLNGGLMLACRDQRRLRPLTFNHLFSAFSTHGASLVTIGGIYLTGMKLAYMLPGILSSDPNIHLLYSTQLKPEQLEHLTVAPQSAVILLGSLLLFTVMLMAYWFAPALVVLGKKRTVEAMKLSMAACSHNFPAFLLYGLIMFILLLVATIPAMLGFLIVIPVGFISYYTSYQDIFRQPETE